MTLDTHNRITVDPTIMVGKPIIKGTRITVELILRLIAQGLTIDDIRKEYQHLTREDILAAVEYASHLVEEETIYPANVTPYEQPAVAR